ncbi:MULTISPECIES: AbrB/MazE/SpoVT family DNA-binding domain-containing protein [Leptolyngbya]|uniref:AbrB/MazE/SpoVT family DNA-binding domain-containing protein n=1 Tax=Leptolyngbya TaxID=47251 RepID=UPI001688EBE9|nr:AbrB/MazE/SpoVT family DNA-binding domain-containing protein [Leptolyngbya sp. FACHB-1624]MBD1856849.1 AbrB/MazE/SpoVT family DNA-binding domain-containing protein [Leptolyngbya sp. FACHB-1624]
MSGTIRTRLVKFGNSQGIRIPKPLLEQSGIQSEVEIEVEGNRLIIRPVSHPRAGWEAAIAAEIAKSGDEGLLNDETSTQWDETEWQW